ncbi:MAG: UDP-N-acetylmuramoyl-tripeptide-D-alanyl-D-alanine ligase [Candidatus Midichloriaceae bacterium]|jgi:UDP-N-acetylmuramoyl-tripeptide--D-alanyl-D-alanine ligase|nr:UDP-N-acetylmuramoyl-tripeptide-D-alanyl-D-alanine ligase [Candidatus Midichloriaceae bacterium]
MIQNSDTHPLPIWESSSLREALDTKVPDGITSYSISIDSRTITKGSIFVALKGESYNGNSFAIEALNKGAAACIIDERIEGIQEYPHKLIMVKDTVQALEDLAHYSRARTKAKIIGITGSVGKTTTKELLKAALDLQGEVYATMGNLNNHFGLPLSLANMPIETKYGIFELGMNHAGEILNLTNIAKPDVTIITTIEAVHLEFFSSVSAIAEAKAEIFRGMGKEGVAIINNDNPYHLILEDSAKALNLNIIKFGSSAGCDYILESYFTKNTGAEIIADLRGKIVEYFLPISGRHHALNSLAVLAAVEAVGADAEFAARKGLSNFEPQKRRGQITHVPSLDITIIDDCYNASPASVAAAIDNLSASWPENRLLVALGDMKELGVLAQEFHVNLKENIIRNNISKVFCVGELMEKLFAALPSSYQGFHAYDAASIAKEILKHVKPKDVILVKGSRSMQMEKVVDALLTA